MAHSPAHDGHDDASHGTVSSYLVGFVLSVILTAASFGVVLGGWFASTTTMVLALAVLAAVQIVVHLIFFLHMNTSSGQRWNLTAFVYTVLTVGIVIVGSLWIMHNVSMNMMSR
ncbi:MULTISPECIES: cytochrome o ubiquinol oxidase subunit IV [unclassified Burkholderia]|uniref:cytochrome o ubiquinol oxidase subunit IV n=1 Tax=unclassified Burkholderia TaxID=2613784 RepID=UPI0004681F28|nr:MULTISPECIES: cytochrome o ubiquinol oxidase subunit IV [unclassified Burkholderia]NIE83424.1 cytochrome o ubiquinol oxidase subunit IV [Burkholderia sp. Tr-860]NIF64936.1 cytochrome o ubiquinol oxidase subunit IV [Burkholderia sp. Cy-647]NIF71088.1 cytochrome o ubiquinol oxidase subunit IV [Burkholderia sp. Ap-962]NIF89587.1 cytochrome o ubiquinol oxidase subunit IV [Burkholderia sp. Cy-637]NIF96989.1 cytochrome o ubiquinol oxidase subunit IV [Burkholderia sp. Ax-1720]